jgi:hypothetical protein
MLNRVLLYVFSFIIILLSIFNQINAQCDPRFDLKPIPGKISLNYYTLISFNFRPKMYFILSFFTFSGTGL